MKDKQILMPVILTAIAGIFLYSSQLNNDQTVIIKNDTEKLSPIVALKEVERWSISIDRIGSEKTYEEFKKEYASASMNNKHGSAHMIGDLLYKKNGINGLGVCDSTFFFGCYHGFFSQAISEHGIGIVADLDKVCLQKFGFFGSGCQHGIGHGLIEYFGPSGLVKALEACESTTRVNELFGCPWGAFMEYNTPIVITENSVYQEPRQINPDNLYEPCNTIVPEKFRKACYFELSSWWRVTGKIDYQKIGQLCDSIDDRYREPCYIGTGNSTAASKNYNVQDIIETCKKMPDNYGEIICRSGAVYALKSVPEEKPLAETICDGLEENDKQLCIQKSELIKK